MKHQKSIKKLNLAAPHRRALLRNQVISLILNGSLTTTKARAKEVKRLAEKMVTLARGGNTFNNRRRAKELLPYKEEALVKLFTEIAPQYVTRPGGYTRLYLLGRRMSDTAEMARLEWVV
ncbi:MAG: 50S ribosomal protein L17 [candidate division TM6 bacterium GW2011_GWE2_42_60]|nr:MAG: 50S ribosomal protein L17 [candidate division TM6 bacterium GW2011_GWE2_42_60]HBY05549.1 50S ribosomal protein L17 [Candidatus Dependentiae bacterium]